MKVQFKSIQVALILWFVFGSLFNLFSWQSIMIGGSGWAGNTPLQSQVVLIMLGAIVTASHLIPARRIALSLKIIAIVILLLGGVLRHFLADSVDYHSSITYVSAIGINLFGSIALCISAFNDWSNS